MPCGSAQPAPPHDTSISTPLDLDTCLVEAPTSTDGALSPQRLLSLRHILQHPSVDRAVVDRHTAFLQHLFELAIARGMGHVPPRTPSFACPPWPRGCWAYRSQV